MTWFLWLILYSWTESLPRSVILDFLTPLLASFFLGLYVRGIALMAFADLAAAASTLRHDLVLRLLGLCDHDNSLGLRDQGENFCERRCSFRAFGDLRL